MKKLVCVMLALVAALGAVGCGEPKFEEVWITEEPQSNIVNQVCVSADGTKTYFTGYIGLKQVGEREYEIWVHYGYDYNTGATVTKMAAYIILNEGGMIAAYRYWRTFEYMFVVTDTPYASAYFG